MVAVAMRREQEALSNEKKLQDQKLKAEKALAAGRSKYVTVHL